MNVSRLETPYGFLDYQYLINTEHPDGLLILMGGYINKEERGRGRYTEMLLSLFKLFPIGTIVQATIAHKGLIPLFRRLGFAKVEKITVIFTSFEMLNNDFKLEI